MITAYAIPAWVLWIAVMHMIGTLLWLAFLTFAHFRSAFAITVMLGAVQRDLQTVGTMIGEGFDDVDEVEARDNHLDLF